MTLNDLPAYDDQKQTGFSFKIFSSPFCFVITDSDNISVIQLRGTFEPSFLLSLYIQKTSWKYSTLVSTVL